MPRRRLIPIILTTVLACASSPATIEGTVNAQTLAPIDAVLSTTTDGKFTRVTIANVSGICADFGSNIQRRKETVLDMYLSPAVTAPGTFVVDTSTGTVQAGWVDYDGDAGCIPTITQATAGSITITSASIANLDGTFDLSFNLDHVTGTFHATSCTFTLDGSAPTCE